MPAEERRHDQRDEPQDQIRLAEVASLEALGPLHLANEERRHDADEDEHAEDVDEEEEPPLVPEPRQRPVRVDGAEERHQDRREEDDEAPEDERVHEPRPEPLQQLALAEHDRRLGADASPDLAGAARGLPEPNDAVEEVRAAEEQAAGDRERPGQDERRSGRAHPGAHDRAARSAALTAGRISCMSPITA